MFNMLKVKTKAKQKKKQCALENISFSYKEMLAYQKNGTWDQEPKIPGRDPRNPKVVPWTPNYCSISALYTPLCDS